MSNSWKGIFPVPGGARAVETTGDLFTWQIEHPIRVTDVVLVVSVLCAIDMTDGVYALDGTISGHPNGDSRQEIGRVTLTEADAVGTSHSMAEEDATWFVAEFNEGDTLFIEGVTAAADSGTVAGDYYINIYYELIPDGVA